MELPKALNPEVDANVQDARLRIIAGHDEKPEAETPAQPLQTVPKPKNASGLIKPKEFQRLSTRVIVGGGLFLILSNIASILEVMQDGFKALGIVFSIIPQQIPSWMIVTAIMIAVVAGNLLLARLLYTRFTRHAISTHKVGAAAFLMLLGSVLVVANASSVARLRPNLPRVTNELVSNLLRAAAASQDGGFRTDYGSPTSREDAWTTAQSVEALLVTSPNVYKEQIRAGFDYLNRNHTRSGWTSEPMEPPYVRTEISSWVLAAYVKAFRSGSIWSKKESTVVTAQITAYLNELLGWQDRTGAWGPITDVAESNDRTYATVVAVWALAEAEESPSIETDLKRQAGQSMQNGVDWLIRNYRSNYGWDQNPRQPGSDKFNGLNYQAMYALEKAEKIDGYNSFKNLRAYVDLKSNFVQTMEPMRIEETTVVPSTDLNVGGKACWATFLGYPWSLAGLSELREDPSLTSAERRKVHRVLRIELDEVGELPKYWEKGYTWALAETVIGISYLSNAL